MKSIERRNIGEDTVVGMLDMGYSFDECFCSIRADRNPVYIAEAVDVLGISG
jgi:hypothetical protein